MKPSSSHILFVALGAAALLLSGCNPAPKYARPPAQTPAAFKEAPPEFKEGSGWKVAQPGDDQIRPKWWEMYNDPQLNALEEQVQISNQNVAAAEASFRAARALVISARNALAPVIAASPSFTANKVSETSRRAVITGGGTTTSNGGTTSTPGTVTSSGGTTSVVKNWSFPVDLSYTLGFWHRIRNTIAVNAYEAQASAGDVATAVLSTQAELASTYFELRATDAQRVILDETVANYRQNLALTRTLFETGIDSEEGVAQAQTQYDTAVAELTDLGVARANYEHAIATLIGRPASNFALSPAPFVPVPPVVPVAVPSVLLERRPDIAAAERRVAAANAEIGVVRAAYYPDVALSATGGVQTSSFAQWFTWPSRFWSIGPQISEQIFDAGVRRAQNQQAQALYEQTVATYRQSVLTAFQAVEDDLASLRVLASEREQRRTAVASAMRSLDLATARFKSGVDSYLNVITAQNAVLNARVTELQIELRQMSSSVGLIVALGGGWQNSQLPEVKSLSGKHSAASLPEPPKEPQPAAAANPPRLARSE